MKKTLPVQGGMGAGSANAAAALIGLERELGAALPGVERLKLAAEVGSGVPLVLMGGGGGAPGGGAAEAGGGGGVACAPVSDRRGGDGVGARGAGGSDAGSPTD